MQFLALLNYSYFHVDFPSKCPICVIQTQRKTRTFKTLRQLSWHLAREHVKEGNCSSKFTFKDLQAIIKTLAFAMQIGILPFTRKNYPGAPGYPRVKRFLELDIDERYFRDCEDECNELIELEDKT